MQVTYRVALEVASHEALIRQAYKDSVGIWTWAVGMTDATGHSVSRYINNPADLQHCMNVYAWALKNYSLGVQKAFRGHTLTEAQFAAALSFHWNTGAIERATWVKEWKAGDIARARKSFMNWVTPKEITARRRAERDLFFDGVWSNRGTMTEYTRLTSRSTPVWASAVKIDVSLELAKAFSANAPHIRIDTQMEPASQGEAPTLSPEGIDEANAVVVPPTPKPPEGGLWAVIARLFERLFGGK